MKIKKLAAIDIGSNAIRLLINHIYESENSDPIFNKTSLVRMPIRLGKDVFINDKISKANIDRICKAMKAYQLMMDVYEVDEYLAYATSAMREAKNGNLVVDKIKQSSGLNIELISGKVEAEVIFGTELKEYVHDEQNYLYVDVGGGSTELTLLAHGKILKSESFKVGTVRMLENKVDASIFPTIKQWIKQYVTQYNVELIGSGGNINHVFKYSGTPIGTPLKSSYLKKHYKLIQSLSYHERLNQLNMKPDRADVVEHALDIYTKVMMWSNAKKIHVPKIGLADGMIRHLYRKTR